MIQLITIMYSFGDMLDEQVGGGGGAGQQTMAEPPPTQTQSNGINWGNVGQSVVGGLGGILTGGIGGLIGELFQGHNNQVQLQQAKDLAKVQLQSNEALSSYNFGQQYDLWNKTNYPAQVQQLEKAGLNPALLYGKSGGAGTTTGSPSGGQGGQSAAPDSGAMMGLMNAAANSQEIQADINLKNAQADKIKSETPTNDKLGDVGVANTKADTALKTTQQTGQDIANKIQNATSDDQIQQQAVRLQQMATGLAQQVQQQQITQETMDAQIQEAKAKSVGAILQNALTKAQTTTEGTKPQMNIAQINKWANEVQQGWQSLDNQAKMMKITGIMNEVQEYNTGTHAWGTTIRQHDPASIAKQIDMILGIGKEDFKK